MLGEFFATPEGEIESILELGPFKRFRTVEARGLTNVSLATLAEILGVGTYDEVADRLAEGPQADHGESGVFILPDEFRDALAALPEGEIAAQWSGTEELTADGWRAEDVAALLAELADLAQEALAQGNRLAYWWSL